MSNNNLSQVYSANISLTTFASCLGIGMLAASAALFLFLQLPKKTLGEQRTFIKDAEPPKENKKTPGIFIQRRAYHPKSLPEKIADPILPSEACDFPEKNSSDKCYFIRYTQSASLLNRLKKRPLILFFPGNAFITRDQYSDLVCQQLISKYPESQVIMINTRLAPEFKYPIPHDDAMEMVDFLLSKKNRERLGIDPQQVFLIGYSSGGNFALNAALKLRGAPEIKVKKLILISPFINFDLSSLTMIMSHFWDKRSILKGFLKQLIMAYAGSHALNDKILSPLLNPDLTDLPQTVIIIGKKDYVSAEAQKLLSRLNAAKNESILITVDNDEQPGHGALWRIPNLVYLISLWEPKPPTSTEAPFWVNKSRRGHSEHTIVIASENKNG